MKRGVVIGFRPLLFCYCICIAAGIIGAVGCIATGEFKIALICGIEWLWFIILANREAAKDD